MQFLKWFKYSNLGNLHVVKQTPLTPEPLPPAPAPCSHQPWEVVAFTSKTNTSVGMFSVALCASALDCFKLQQGAGYV